MVRACAGQSFNRGLLRGERSKGHIDLIAVGLYIIDRLASIVRLVMGKVTPCDASDLGAERFRLPDADPCTLHVRRSHPGFPCRGSRMRFPDINILLACTRRPVL
jgi:hypothetical protein